MFGFFNLYKYIILCYFNSYLEGIILDKVKNVKIGNVSRSSIYKIYRKNTLEQVRFYDTKTSAKVIALKYKTR